MVTLKLWAASMLVPVLGVDAAGASPVFTIFMTIGGPTLVLAAFHFWSRRRGTSGTPGEGPSAAADSVASGAALLAGSLDSILGPLRAANATLTRDVAELQANLAQTKHALADALIEASNIQAALVRVQAQAMTERHDMAEKLAVVNVQYAQVLAELETYRVRSGEAPDRRGERRDDAPSE